MSKKQPITPRPLLELLELAERRERWNREVGESLRRARVDAGLSQGELARALNASQAYVSQIEHGKGMSADQLRFFHDTLEAAAGASEEPDRRGEDEHAKRTRKRKPRPGG
jgi:transcriptional regulator with XRE-family HTH domain